MPNNAREPDLAVSPTIQDLSRPQARIALAVIVLAVLLLRLLPIYRQPGGQDEEYYAVPGLTILESGIPRLPHAPARNPESVYFRGDEALFSEPPVYFYLQAAFYALLPHVYGTARLASLVSGIAGLWLLYRIGRGWGISRRGAVWSILLFSLSRWFIFPAMHARPDMLCATFGFAVILMLQRWQRTRRFRDLAAAGLFIGLGGLTHPFAVAYAVQAAVWAWIVEQGGHRWLRPVQLAAISIGVACLWLPLILMFPEASGQQFRNQYFHGEGEPLWLRVLMPWTSLAYHADVLWKHIGVWQILFPTAATLISSIAARGRTWGDRWGAAAIALSGTWAIAILVGDHHQVLGYWVYPAGFLFLGVGRLLDQLAEVIAALRIAVRPAIAGIGLALAAAMVPGAGLRTVLVHLRHWNDVNYNAPRFARSLLSDLPRDATYAVDAQFALDFFVAGRKSLPAQILPQYFRVEQFDFDYLVVSRNGLDTNIAARFPGEMVLRKGNRDDPFACYVEVYRCHHRADPPAP